MGKHVTRELETRKKEYRGASEAKHVTAWLNADGNEYFGLEARWEFGARNKNTKASRNRIHALITAIQELNKLLKEGPYYDRLNTFVHNKKFASKVQRLQDEINTRLERYPTVPCLLADTGNILVAEDSISGACPVGESVAAYDVLDLAKMGLVDRISLCICGKYFFQNLENQRFCSGPCRHKNYEQSEEFKARRREYMRKYYKLKTSGKVK